MMIRPVAMVILCAATATQAAPAIAPPYAPLFDKGHSWTYTVTTTAFNDVDPKHESVLLPEKNPPRSSVTCKVAEVIVFKTATVSMIKCDKEIDDDYSIRVDGEWVATKDGISRGVDIDLPQSAGDISIGMNLLAMKPTVARTNTKTFYGPVVTAVTNPATGTWCKTTDTTGEADGAIETLCFAAGVGITRGKLDYYGGWPRTVEYSLKQP
jgi:hypothetical protein